MGNDCPLRVQAIIMAPADRRSLSRHGAGVMTAGDGDLPNDGWPERGQLTVRCPA